MKGIENFLFADFFFCSENVKGNTHWSAGWKEEEKMDSFITRKHGQFYYKKTCMNDDIRNWDSSCKIRRKLDVELIVMLSIIQILVFQCRNFTSTFQEYDIMLWDTMFGSW